VKASNFAVQIIHVKKQQWILFGSGLAVFLLLWLVGTTVSPNKPEAPAQAAEQSTFNENQYITSIVAKLPANQQAFLKSLSAGHDHGNAQSEINHLQQVAQFWKDSVRFPELYVYYLGKAAQLENSEKSLTFAAQLTLSELRHEQDMLKRGWKSEQAAGLFEQALKLSPDNDSLKLGLGSSYVFGKGMAGDAQETMKGIQVLLELVRKDSTNMRAQLVLGIGGVISTQYDKAIDRLLKVVEIEPGNLEAISWLADAYGSKGDKANAIKWYEASKKLVDNPEFSKEVDERIKQLK
jgi:tetratricopeptide (TPR) repeat protein